MPRTRDLAIFVLTADDDCFTPCACARGKSKPTLHFAASSIGTYSYHLASYKSCARQLYTLMVLLELHACSTV